VDLDRVKYWQSKGAIASERVVRLLKDAEAAASTAA